MMVWHGHKCIYIIALYLCHAQWQIQLFLVVFLTFHKHSPSILYHLYIVKDANITSVNITKEGRIRKKQRPDFSFFVLFIICATWNLHMAISRRKEIEALIGAIRRKVHVSAQPKFSTYLSITQLWDINILVSIVGLVNDN